MDPEKSFCLLRGEKGLVGLFKLLLFEGLSKAGRPGFIARSSAASTGCRGSSYFAFAS